MRARELCGQGAELDAEDLVGDCYLKLVEKPPQPRSPTQLKHWLRTVMLNRYIDSQRRRGDQEPDAGFDVALGSVDEY